MKKYIITIIVIAFTLSLFANTIYVPDDFSTIQAAINAASDYDQIIVRDGVYSGGFWLESPNVILKSEHGNNFTTIDCNSGGSIVILEGTLDGFNFIGSRENQFISIGGYENNEENPPTIKNCSFDNVENTDDYFPFIIYAQTNYDILNCRFTNINGTVIYHEGYVGSGYGPSSTVHITHCLFDNVGYAFSSATYDYILLGFRNNTVVNSDTGLSFGLSNDNRHIHIKNCIFANNVYGVKRYQGGSDITITYSDFYNNTHNTQGCNIGENCIFANPMLTPHISYLKEESPCVNSGENGYYMGWYYEEAEDKPFTKGWNWVSFPRLLRWNNEPQNSIEVMNPLDPYAKQVLSEESFMTYNGQNWTPYGLTEMQSCWGYKVEMGDYMPEYNYESYGERLSEYYKIPYVLEANQYHWLGYWLPETQNIVDAFGDLWQYVEKVKAQDWYYDRQSIISKDGALGTPSYSTTNKNMEYGKAYMIWFKDTNIVDFHWTNSGISREPYVKEKPEHFTYQEKADYEVVDIIDIPNDVLEIGVFNGDKCVGAVKVNDNAEQIILYTDASNRDSEPISFELYQGRGKSSIIKHYKVMNFKTGEFEETMIYPRKQSYTLISLNNESSDNQDIPDIYSVTLKNYPNPFNPETTFSYSLPKDGKVSINIYTLKGEKVKTLVNGYYKSGHYTSVWNGKNDNGKSVSSGVYFYKLKTKDKTIIRKMMLLK